MCEYFDLDGTELSIAVRLRGYEGLEGEQIEAQLVTRGGRVVQRAEAPLVPRVNTVGIWSRSQALLKFDANRLSNGAYRLELIKEGTTLQIDPSTGLLASSRPRSLDQRWVQVLPGVSTSTWFRFGSRSGTGRLWRAVTNLVRDIAFAANTRRFTWVRPVRALTKFAVPRGPIWLIGERPETARDNGWKFFQYARSRVPSAPVFYVMARHSPARKGLDDANILDHSSLRHRLLILHADVLINAYSIKHMLPSRWHPGAYMKQAAWRIGARRVYLKHGVHLSPEAVKRANGGYDFVCTVGPGETAALQQTSGYSTQLKQTGLARYDSLLPTETSERRILFMPTWRRYLVPTLFAAQSQAKVEFEGSEYQRFIQGFLESPELARTLERHGLILDFVPHYNLGELLSGVGRGHDRIRVHDARTADIPRLIRECSMLCTDYSSVHFDAAYLGVPVAYVQVDKELYLSGHSTISWFDFDRDGFGPVTHDVAEAIEQIDRYARNRFMRETEYEVRVSAVFSHRDTLNAKRIFEGIQHIL